MKILGFFRLINNESFPINFNIKDDSNAIEAGGWCVRLSEKKGTIPPNSQIEIQILVEASRPGELV